MRLFVLYDDRAEFDSDDAAVLVVEKTLRRVRKEARAFDPCCCKSYEDVNGVLTNERHEFMFRDGKFEP